jgi:hypothetical protein
LNASVNRLFVPLELQPDLSSAFLGGEHFLKKVLFG